MRWRSGNYEPPFGQNQKYTYLLEFIDLATQQTLLRDKIEARIKVVLNHGKYIMGAEVNELEEKLAEYVGVKYCIS